MAAVLRSMPAGVERLPLADLSTEAVAEVAAGELGYPPSGELAARIADRCGGNPFFVREVARLHASRRQQLACASTRALAHCGDGRAAQNLDLAFGGPGGGSPGRRTGCDTKTHT